jgi:HPt (histidine-containing phosphotransfer) domain-containing protein
MTKITSQDAIDLAKQFKEAAVAVGDFQLQNWDNLSKDDRRSLTDVEYTLLDYSQDLVTYAVGKALDDAQASLAQIKDATARANRVVKTVNDVKKVIGIATALVTLGAAIYTGNVGGIVTALKGVYDAAKPNGAIAAGKGGKST